jgi:hypothetical protein
MIYASALQQTLSNNLPVKREEEEEDYSRLYRTWGIARPLAVQKAQLLIN